MNNYVARKTPAKITIECVRQAVGSFTVEVPCQFS